jgi:hypothetical protein
MEKPLDKTLYKYEKQLEKLTNMLGKTEKYAQEKWKIRSVKLKNSLSKNGKSA